MIVGRLVGHNWFLHHYRRGGGGGWVLSRMCRLSIVRFIIAASFGHSIRPLKPLLIDPLS